MTNQYSTIQAAEKLGISLMTLNRYLAANKIPAPEVQLVGRFRIRLWSDSDIEKVRNLLPKIANGRKTRHQKASAKQAKKKFSKPEQENEES